MEYIYYFYNEDTTHHFHNWMNEFGRSVESVRPVLLHARNHMNKTEDIKEVMDAIKLLKKEMK